MNEFSSELPWGEVAALERRTPQIIGELDEFSILDSVTVGEKPAGSSLMILQRH